MINLGLAQIFYEIADILEMEEVAFKPEAYERAARFLEVWDKDVAEVYKQGGLKALEALPGVGKGIALKIEEYIKTGRIKEHQQLKKKCPVDIDALRAIEGLGPRKIKLLYQKLGIKNIGQLEKAARAGKVSRLAGFGQKSEQNILEGIAFVKSTKGRFLLGLILPKVREIISRLKELPQTGRVEVAGSIRRMKETIGDIDILATSDQPAKVMDFFIQMPEVVKVWAKGPTKSSVRLQGGFDSDLRVIKKQSFGAALQYFTGNKEHNILLRRLARKKGMKLNEYGLFKGKQPIAGQREKEIYQKLGLPFIPPELRTNRGEIEAALAGQLPRLIGYNEIKGDCQSHTTWSDGSQGIKEMALAAKKMGYEYLAITDHTGSLRIAHGLDEKRLLSQMEEIDRVNQEVKGIKILKGCEANIKDDGRLDIKDKVLAKLDIVLAGVHSRFKMSKKDMTERLIKAMENPWVKLIVHPTGRIIFRREGYQLDWPAIFKAARRTKTALEINAHYDRLDLKDLDAREAARAGVKLMINTDAHSTHSLAMIELGIATARRAWLTKKDILNSRSWEKMLAAWK